VGWEYLRYFENLEAIEVLDVLHTTVALLENTVFQVDKNTVTANDFTVLVKWVPPDVTQEELKQVARACMFHQSTYPDHLNIAVGNATAF
jgi:hypothetical protein